MLISSLSVLLLGFFAIFRLENKIPLDISPLVIEEPILAVVEDKSTKPSSVLPEAVNLPVSFTSQAPTQNWDAMHEEFCEEASMLMVASYIKNQPIISPADADKKLRDIMNFEIKRFGYYADTTAEETAMILREYFNLSKVAVVNDPTIEQIKTALADDNVVVMPEAGRQLGNPNFKRPGPLYHMLVIKGYQKNGDLITNDPGTKKGADYIYKSSVILSANHDWNGGNVNTGRKVMIVVGT